MKWEYKIHWCGDNSMHQMLSTLGEDGWECFAVIREAPLEYSTSLNVQLFFKKPL